jgi:hypothetical protein
MRRPMSSKNPSLSSLLNRPVLPALPRRPRDDQSQFETNTDPFADRSGPVLPGLPRRPRADSSVFDPVNDVFAPRSGAPVLPPVRAPRRMSRSRLPPLQTPNGSRRASLSEDPFESPTKSRSSFAWTIFFKVSWQTCRCCFAFDSFPLPRYHFSDLEFNKLSWIYIEQKVPKKLDHKNIRMHLSLAPL